jgi:hypothetical protein
MRVVVRCLAVILAARASAAVLHHPAAWYGIVPGVSKEPNVIALYGPGYFRDTLGDTGSRTYIIAKGGGTLTFVFGFDKEVDSIQWEAGTRTDIPRAIRSKITINAEPKRWLGWSAALAAGATVAKIKEWFGEPTTVTSDGQWNYDAYEASCEAAYLTLRFKNGVVINAEYVAPAGE